VDINADDGGFDDFADGSEGGGQVIDSGEVGAHLIALFLGTGELLVEGELVADIRQPHAKHPEEESYK
jgi:hypothetical protein